MKADNTMTLEQYKAATAPSEDVEQMHLISWCRWAENKWPELAAIYHIPNEGKRSKAEGGRMKAMGLSAGVPDICLPVARGGFGALYIEMKKQGGKPTAEQINWLEMLERYGNAVAICEGAEQAEKVITAYMERDTDTLDKLLLMRDYGDFDKLRGRKKQPKADTADCLLPVVCGAELGCIIADSIQFGTITGRSFVPIIIVLVLILCSWISEAYTHIKEEKE